MARWFILFSLFLAACDSGNIDPDFKPEEYETDDSDTMASPEESDDDLDGFAEVDGDCDDTDPTIHPDAEDLPADGVDQNCDGSEICFADADDDGILPEATPTLVSADGDCNDANEGTSADPIGDCDDSDASVGLPTTWYADGDDDGLGDATESLAACEQPDGYVDNDVDNCTTIDGSAGGDGSEEDPFIVCDATTLQRVDLDLNAHYLQTVDIDLTESSIIPIEEAAEIEEEVGDDLETEEDAEEDAEEEESFGFQGHYDGGDHMLIGLQLDETSSVSSEDTPTALFRTVGPYGLIENLTLVDVDVHSNSGAAALAGILMGTIRNVDMTGIIDISGNFQVGGIAATMATGDESEPPSISNVSVDEGNLTNKGTGEGVPFVLGAGGIVGSTFGGSVSAIQTSLNVKWEWNESALGISVDNSPAAGGAIGRTFATSVWDIHTAGNVEGIHNVGGVIGSFYLEPSEDCATDKLTSSGDIMGVGESVGGVAGVLDADVCRAGSTGSVSGAFWLGGIAGMSSAEAHCDRCFSSSDIVAIEGEFTGSAGIGGLWGYADGAGTLSNSVFTGRITSTASSTNLFGGIMGVSVINDEHPMEAHHNMMLGAVEPEEGGLIVGSILNLGPTATLTEAYFSDNLFVDHNEDIAPDTAGGSGMEFADIYWGESIALEALGDLSDTAEAFDFDDTWTMATTTDADSPLYAQAHPVLVWQCAYDPTIICDTMD